MRVTVILPGRKQSLSLSPFQTIYAVRHGDIKTCNVCANLHLREHVTYLLMHTHTLATSNSYIPRQSSMSLPKGECCSVWGM